MNKAKIIIGCVESKDFKKGVQSTIDYLEKDGNGLKGLKDLMREVSEAYEADEADSSE